MISPCRFIPLLLALACFAGQAALADPAPTSWSQALAQAKGETVYFNAWGGDPKINAFIAWAAGRLQADYGVTLRQVKLSDTGEAVARVLAEKTAGRSDGGSVDLIWINGANFAAMKRQGLLFGPFTQMLPNYRLVDVAGKPTTAVDFTVPVEGLEAPWGMAQIVFIYDTARVSDPPRSMAALLAWAEAHPGRFTYPAPPDFTGTTFLKQALYELSRRSSAARQARRRGGFRGGDGTALGLSRQAQSFALAPWPAIPAEQRGHAPGPRRWRDRHRFQLQSRRGELGHRPGPAAADGAQLCLRSRQHRQYAFPRHSLRCQCQGRRHGRRRIS